MAEVPQYRLGEMERKLLTLLALSRLGPCGNLQLIAFMQTSDLMNYFDLQQALYELRERGQVFQEALPGDERYGITPQGEEAIRLFSGRVAPSLVERLEEAAPAFLEELRRDRELFAGIHHEGRNEYHARMGIAEGGLTLLALDFSLPTAELADRFRAAWAENARDIYDYLITRLSGEGAP